MMKTKRTLAWGLMLVMLAMTVLSCGKTPTTADESYSATTTATSSADTTTTAATTEIDPTPALPTADFKGEDFVILTTGRSDDYRSIEFKAEEITGDTVGDAVFNRNAYIEETYHVNLVNSPVSGSSELSALEKSVMSGTHTYDLALIRLMDAGPFGLKGHLMDLNTMPNLYLEGAWWDQNAVEDLSLAGRLYMGIGDLNINDKDMTWCLFFDKSLAEEYHLPDLYAMAKNKEWTFDKLHELCRGVSGDLNGDGKFDDNDRYGHVTVYARSTIAYMYSMGAEIFTKDANGLPIMNANTEELIDAYSVARNLFFDSNVCHDVETMPKNGFPNSWRRCENMFGNKQILFYAEAMQNAQRFRNSVNEFGILPLPSGEEGSYGQHMVWKESYVTVAPVTLSASQELTDRAGLLLEAIQRASSDTILPAYYDIALKTKFSRDDSSSEMIDIVFATRYYDIGSYYGWGGMTDVWMGQGKIGSENVSSALKSLTKVTERALANCVKALTEGES